MACFTLPAFVEVILAVKLDYFGDGNLLVERDFFEPDCLL